MTEPLPQPLEQWRTSSRARVSEELPSSSEMSTYDKNLPETLTRKKVYDEKFPPDNNVPNNFSEIQNAIHNDDSTNQANEPSEQDIAEYITFCKNTSNTSKNEGQIAKQVFNPYFNIGYELEELHESGTNQKWVDFPEPQDLPKPRPDYFEGLKSMTLAEWIERTLKVYGKPVSGVALPNFLAELKAEGSMKVCHTQCRLDGAFAARGYYQLHVLYPHLNDDVLKTAWVGSIEFNGEVCIGNVHWIDKPSKHAELEYHMKRIFCIFTKGLGIEDFVKGRRVARSFREYFAELRVEHLRRLQKLKDRPCPPEYAKLNVPALKAKLRERNLPVKGNKPELVNRLEENDEEDRRSENAESIIERVSHIHVQSQGSNPSQSFEDPGPSNPGHSFGSQKRGRESSTDEIQPPRGKKRAQKA